MTGGNWHLQPSRAPQGLWLQLPTAATCLAHTFLSAVFLPAPPFPSPHTAVPRDHLPNKPPAPESLSQHALLGEPNPRQLSTPSPAIYCIPGSCKVYSQPEFLGVPGGESHMLRHKSSQLPCLQNFPVLLLLWTPLRQAGTLLILWLKTVPVDVHFIQEAPPPFTTGHHLSYQPLLPPVGYPLVQGAKVIWCSWVMFSRGGCLPVTLCPDMLIRCHKSDTWGPKRGFH